MAVTNEGVEVATFDPDPNGNRVSHRGTENTEIFFGYDEMNRLVTSISFVSSVNFVVNNTFFYTHEYKLDIGRWLSTDPIGIRVGFHVRDLLSVQNG